MFDVGKNALVESFDRKNMVGSDKITKKNEFVTRKRLFFEKIFWIHLWRLSLLFSSEKWQFEYLYLFPWIL